MHTADLHAQHFVVKQAARERLKGHPGGVIWFTGLSGAGKSTLANALECRLHQMQVHTYLLDGDNVRMGLNRDLDFSPQARSENIRRVAEVSWLMMDAGLMVLTAFISPFQRERELARQRLGSDRFIEVHVSTSLAECERRDVKGLYRKARSGGVAHMTGIGSDYEAPEQPDIRIDTTQGSVDDAVDALLALLRARQWLPQGTGAGAAGLPDSAV